MTFEAILSGRNVYAAILARKCGEIGSFMIIYKFDHTIDR